MKTRRLVMFGAALEILTGAALIVLPGVVGRLLLGVGLSESGAAVGRLAGVALVSLGVACWPAGNRGLLTYNLMVSIYLGYLGAFGGFAGCLLWPAFALHVLMTVLQARARRPAGYFA